ncbi:MAG: response regulator [Planctomycetes bacterium]|nr:response regulator [Planctomycetota bacterium]
MDLDESALRIYTRSKPLMRTSGPTYRVLVVDDNEDDLHLLQEAVTELALPIVMETCASATHAVDLLGIDREFNMILSDLNMPRITGLELFKSLRSKPEFKAISMVLMSSSRRTNLPHSIVNELQFPYFTKATTWPEFLILAQEMYSTLRDGRSHESGRLLAERMTPPKGFPKAD